MAQAIEEAFGYPGTADQRLAAFNTYEQTLSVEPGTKGEDPTTGDEVTLPTVTIANRVFTDSAFEPRAEYVETLETWFGAGAEAVPMRSDPSTAADAINTWVNERTEGLIQDLYSADQFNDDSRLSLVNALYMKAAWQEDLDASQTTNKAFTRLDGTDIQVPLMNAAPTAQAVAQGEGFVAADLAYAGGKHQMLVVVPDAGSFDQVRENLGPGLLADLDDAWLRTVSIVQIPRFEAESKFDLRAVMENSLGWTGIFDVEGLDGIGDRLALGSAVHATKVIVNEEGTEAAAATGIDAALTSAPMDEVVVIADRPFLYVIRDVDTGAALFVGQVLDPTL